LIRSSQQPVRAGHTTLADSRAARAAEGFVTAMKVK
jgi:hypothetical protein